MRMERTLGLYLVIMKQAKITTKILTAQQRLFIENYVSGMTAKDAYIKAGYKNNSDDAVRASASQLLAIPNVRAIIDERLNEIKQNIDDQIKATTDDALRTMRSLLSSEQDFARYQAAKYLLDTAGHKTSENINIGGQKDNPVLHSFLEITSANDIDNEPIDDSDEE